MKQWYIRRKTENNPEVIRQIDATNTRDALTEAVEDYETLTNVLEMQQEVFVLIEAESDGRRGYVPGTEDQQIDIRQTALMLRRAWRPGEEIDLREYLIEQYCGVIINEREAQEIVSHLLGNLYYASGRIDQRMLDFPDKVDKDIEAAQEKLETARQELLDKPDHAASYTAAREAFNTALELLDKEE